MGSLRGARSAAANLRAGDVKWGRKAWRSSTNSKARSSIATPRIGTEIAAAGEHSRISVRGLGPGNSLKDNAGKRFQYRARRRGGMDEGFTGKLRHGEPQG